LGYYSRARNLQKAARIIVEAGAFPTSYDQIRQLAGVGDYTAAAVGSIAFGLPHAAVDGNVIRVTSRLSAERGDVGNSAVRRRLAQFADTLLDAKNAGRHNQAMMELGATVCLPRAPKCHQCPLEVHCAARKLGIERELPLKRKKTLMFLVDRRLLLVKKAGKILLWKRPADSKSMAGFWELPEAGMLPEAIERETLGTFRHSITNHVYQFELVRASLPKIPAGFRLMNSKDLGQQPMSTTTRKALQYLTVGTL
jgi:A/G-specific adenine glycosylase